MNSDDEMGILESLSRDEENIIKSVFLEEDLIILQKALSSYIENESEEFHSALQCKINYFID